MFYQGGDFNIKESWKKDVEALHDKKGVAEAPAQRLGTPGSGKGGSRKKLHDPQSLPSILNQAGKKVMQEGATPTNIDSDLAAKIVNNLRLEGGVADNYLRRAAANPVLAAPAAGHVGAKPPAGRSSGSSEDLLSIMAARLSRVEMLCNSQREELKEKARTVQRLEQELDISKKAGSNSDYRHEITVQREENTRLKKQVQEMEQFLLEYGLKWKGYEDAKKSEDLEVERLKRDLDSLRQPKYKYNLPREIDINIILKRIEELNIIMEKDGGISQVYKDDRGMHQLKKMESLLIGFYANGIVIAGYPFYLYGSNEAHQILADILDGYFPYMLKHRYPNGTLLKVIDKTDERYSAERAKGVLTIEQAQENALKPLSKEEFLQKLPAHVLKDGKVIPVRDEIAKKLQGNQIESLEKQDRDEKAYAHRKEADGTITPLNSEQRDFEAGILSEEQKKNLCLLKIRTQSGTRVIILRIFAEKKISEVYEILRGFSETSPQQGYELVLGITKQVIAEDDTRTLRELEFFPNAALNMRKKE